VLRRLKSFTKLKGTASSICKDDQGKPRVHRASARRYKLDARVIERLALTKSKSAWSAGSAGVIINQTITDHIRE